MQQDVAFLASGAEMLGGRIAREDDRRNASSEPPANLLDRGGAVLPAGKLVVGDDDVRAQRQLAEMVEHLED